MSGAIIDSILIIDTHTLLILEMLYAIPHVPVEVVRLYYECL